MRAGQGTFEPSGVLPIILPPEEDELISSWLDRTARFYSRPLQALLPAGPHRAGPIDFAGIDLGLSRAALVPVARPLGMEVDLLAVQTLAMAYPRAMDLIAWTAALPGARRAPRLRRAACPHCLEEQRVEKGFSWLRREWVLAPRTVCSKHHVMLVEGETGAMVHPTWGDFLRRHHHAAGAVYGASAGTLEPAPHEVEPGDGGPGDDLLHRMAQIQDAMLAETARGQTRRPPTAINQAAMVVGDLVWALTRRDHRHCDRLIYEAFASDRLDSAWHIARRRQPGPVDYRRLHLDERHRIQATATIVAGPPDLRRPFYPGGGSVTADLDILDGRLGPADRAEFAARRAKWAGASTTGSMKAAESTI